MVGKIPQIGNWNLSSLHTKAMIYVTYRLSLLQNVQPIGTLNSGKEHRVGWGEFEEAIIKGLLNSHGRLITEPGEESSYKKCKVNPTKHISPARKSFSHNTGFLCQEKWTRAKTIAWEVQVVVGEISVGHRTLKPMQ